MNVVDVVLAVKEDSVAVYCNHKVYPSLLPYMAHWNNLSLYCLMNPQVVSKHCCCCFLFKIASVKRYSI